MLDSKREQDIETMQEEWTSYLTTWTPGGMHEIMNRITVIKIATRPLLNSLGSVYRENK